MSREKLLKALDILTEGSLASVSPRVMRAASEIFHKSHSWIMAPGVQGMGIGTRSINDKNLVIKVYVNQKRPLAVLEAPAPTSIFIPGLDLEVGIDVEAIGDIELESFITDGLPAHPGNAIGLSENKFGTGTLGCLVTERTNPSMLYLLSNAHVIAQDGLAAKGTIILHPSGSHGGRAPQNVLAKLTRSVNFIFSPTGFHNKMDAALASIIDPASVSPAIQSIGIPTGVRDTPVIRQMGVKKAGALGGFKRGKVKDIDFRCAFKYFRSHSHKERVGFRDQILCSNFTVPGDSGATVLDKHDQVVGLHFAGSNSGPNRCSIFNPINPIFAEFNIDLVTSDHDSVH